MKPSQFLNFPNCSVFQKCEHEDIAQRIMEILAASGDRFRRLPWKEYVAHSKRNHISEIEHARFKSVLPYTINGKRAMSFSPAWREVTPGWSGGRYGVR